jgi:hypothetical protein
VRVEEVEKLVQAQDEVLMSTGNALTAREENLTLT